MKKAQYLDRKLAILIALVETAKAGKKMTYSELGARVGIPGVGPWKGVLDSLAEDEVSAGRPDITFLVGRKSTGYPGQIGFEPADPPSAAQIALAEETFRAVWKRYAVQKKAC